MRLVLIALASAIVAACGAAEPPSAPREGEAPLTSSRSAPSVAVPMPSSSTSTGAIPIDGATAAVPAPSGPPPMPLPPAEAAAAALAIGAPAGGDCSGTDAPDARLRCLVDARWRGTPVAPTALELWDRHRVVVGLEPEHWMDGGFRGRLHLVPEPPAGPYVRHLGWVADAHREIAEVMDEVVKRAAPGASMRFRHRGVVYGFFRSVGRTTPSAYASGWRIGYNVSGSLLGSRDGVLETIFHEIFHLNDDGWSETSLRAIHDAILGRCQGRQACLAPFAPTKTMVRGGTYYSFQPDNGDAVHEYAAEVATRWFQEHRARVRGGSAPAPKPFRCGPEENRRAWDEVVKAFFAGADLTPPCG